MKIDYQRLRDFRKSLSDTNIEGCVSEFTLFRVSVAGTDHAVKSGPRISKYAIACPGHN